MDPPSPANQVQEEDDEHPQTLKATYLKALESLKTTQRLTFLKMFYRPSISQVQGLPSIIEENLEEERKISAFQQFQTRLSQHSSNSPPLCYIHKTFRLWDEISHQFCSYPPLLHLGNTTAENKTATLNEDIQSKVIWHKQVLNHYFTNMLSIESKDIH